MNKGINKFPFVGIIKLNPGMLAFAYTTPISALIRLCDREPEKAEDAVRKIEAFSRHFIAACGVKQQCLI